MTRHLIRDRLRAWDRSSDLGDLHLEQAIDGTAAVPRQAQHRPLKPAAVLVPLVQRADGFHVLLTQRTDHLAHHPGQISFPGGRLEQDDQGDAVRCALRETEEEIGLSRTHVEVLGQLTPYVTGTGFAVVPVVGVVMPPFTLTLDAFEVAEAFEVPLAFVLNKANHTLVRRHIEGRDRPFWTMPWQGRYIWGATAGMLVHLSDVLADLPLTAGCDS